MRAALSLSLPLAERLFEDIGSRTRRDGGILRAPYGEGEQAAADRLAEAARELNLETKTDWAGNLYMHYAGTDAAAPVHLVGSHMDSVPNGGNFDGLAGIVAGLVAIAALQRARAPAAPWHHRDGNPG